MNDITPLTAQQVFDAAVNGIAAQGFKRCVGKDQGCLYRGPDGLKCTVGHSIPDALYKPSLEGKAAFSLVCKPAFKRLYSGVGSDLLNDLQSLHDDEGLSELIDPETFLREAQDLARNYGLVYTAPK